MVASPGLLALLGFYKRPDLWLTAGIAAVPLSLISMAGLAFPLLPAAVVLGMAWTRHPPEVARPRVHPAIVTPVITTAMVAAAVFLFLTDDPVSWTTASGGGSSSDVITDREALASLATIAAALAAAWVMTGPRAVAAVRPGTDRRSG